MPELYRSALFPFRFALSFSFVVVVAFVLYSLFVLVFNLHILSSINVAIKQRTHGVCLQFCATNMQFKCESDVDNGTTRFNVCMQGIILSPFSVTDRLPLMAVVVIAVVVFVVVAAAAAAVHLVLMRSIHM